MKNGDNHGQVRFGHAFGCPRDVGEEIFQTRRMDHDEEASPCSAGVLESVRCALGSKHSFARPGVNLLSVDLKQEFALDDVERLVLAPVAMQRRTLPRFGEIFHHGENSARLLPALAHP